MCPSDDKGGVQVRPVVNGQDLLAEVLPGGVGGSRYMAADPRSLLGRAGALRATAAPREVRLGWSGCGLEMCCGALYVTVRRDGEHVVWSDLRDSANQDFGLPELRFGAGQYDAEVRRAGADRRWQWPGGAVAQLLEEALREREDWLLRWDCELEAVWASRDQPDRIHLVLRHPRGRADTDLPHVQFGTTLWISADAPSVQAEQLEARLTEGDPRATAEVWGGYEVDRLGYPWPSDPLFL
ncbi:hypothetical protein ACIQI7_04580 [Kitasatospora sp. NPDC092039]|uniref:hypothetical protein n=1 Tax=Kitasatospora sp. NPDC092039 TaxID=3364086 RepID=UPI0037F8A0FC